MTFNLSLVVAVYPLSGDYVTGPNVALLQKANAWLQRRNAGLGDDLLFVGIGFKNEVALKVMLKPYGLGHTKVQVEHPDTADNKYELGE